MKIRSALAAVSLCSMLLSQLPIAGMPIPAEEILPMSVPKAVAQACTNTVSLGTSFSHTQTNDSQTDQNGNSVTRQSGGSFTCPAGQVITRIAYLGIEAGNDSTDGLTIACSPLNSNGTLGTQGANFPNSDLSSNSRFPSDLVLTTCNSSNAAVVTVYFNDILNAGREDALDGTGIGCNTISSSGISNFETDTQQPSDITNHGTPVQSYSCPAGTVAVGITYDSFGSTLPADPDAMDSVVRFQCAPVNVTTNCVSQCSDGIDNDGDGATDFPNDFSCSSSTDNDETLPRAACQDSMDNDGDGLVDFPQDPGCTNRQDNDEFNVVATTQCSDGVDNDGDGATDFPNDFSCSSSTDNDETNPRSACQDSIDNDGDGLVDFPQDPGCSNRQDNDEFNTVTAQCSDGIDNDGDGATDFPNDYSCSSATDNDETLPRSQCQDSVDNDGDGLVDFPQDPGCFSRQDNTELNVVQCNDGIDNDGDGATDFPNDFSCSSSTDNDETLPRAACQDSIDNDGDGLVDFPQDPGCSSRQDNDEFNSVQCNDGIDNDGDGSTDFPNDFSCSSSTDNDETLPRAACQDSIDNDGDGLTDFPQDPGCSSRQDNDEFNAAQCSDGIDNDGDGATDFPNDFSCSSSGDNDETLPRSQCQDSIDNDGDGLVDFPQDPGCASRQDNTELNVVQCSDGIDNDGDGATDFPNDFSCSSATDNDETLPRAACQDSIDNDGDGLVDFPQDPGCLSRQDNDEFNSVQCNDGIDNDGDGSTDFPNDFSCSSSTDNDETLPRAACQDSIDNDGDGLTDFPQDPGCVSRQDNDEFNQIQADLSITKSGPSSVARGAVVSYTVTATNAGPNTATNVTIADPIPAGLTFSSVGSTASCVQNGSNILCNNITLNAGQSVTRTIAFTVSSTFTCGGTISNQASVSTSATDPNPANNQSAVISTTVTCVQCSDGADNDGDGATDFPNDFSCSSATDNDETLPRAACQDSIDNDGDGLVDFPQDPGCLSRQDNDEFNSVQCNDGVDNDGDGATDFPNDFSCSSATDNDETLPRAACQDSVDNDGDGLVDFPQDPGCLSRQDNDEFNSVQCNDGVDNDGDGATDFPNDFSCSSPTDNDETLPRAACQDSVDNDGDGLVDFPQDPGCLSRQDNDEFNSVQCNDGVDNDGDGATDFPNDFSCSSSTDNDETLPRAACQDSIDNDGDGLVDFPQDPGCLSRQDNDEFNSIQADLNISKTGPTSVARGAVISYTVTAANAGPNTATNVTIADPIPAGLTFNSAGSTASCIQNGSNILCNNITLSAGQSVTRTIAFTVSATFTCNGTISNQASVSTSATDPNPANNQSGVVSTSVTCVQCSDGADNDGDGATDFPNDFSCSSATDNDETLPRAACQDSIDNDGDGLVDFPQDPGCVSRQDNDEFNVVQCNDGIDNDGDGATDFPNDFSCSSSTDNDETLPRAACQDSIDNDGDGLVDFPQDPGCLSRQDNDEFNQPNADLSIVKSGVNSIQRGSTLLYTLTATNFGPDTATNVTMADPIPAGLTFNSGASDASCVQNGSNILCNNITLTSGQSVTRTIAFNVPSTFTCNGVINNQASVSTSATDPNPSNNQSAVVSTTVTCPLAQCQDGIDNDGDGATDFPNDFSCSSASDTDETLPRTQCQDSIDNDGDGLFDFPQDPGCSSNQDNSELNTVQCNDGLDNDGDGATDFPNDFSCSSATDNDETLPRSACQDSVDNDGDGLVDFPQDPGCVSRQDNNEFNTVTSPACSDGVDNDGDNLIDFPQDPGCTSSTDTTENNTVSCGGGSTVALGTSFLTAPTDDSQTDQFGNPVTRQVGGTFNCPAGQVITRVAYLGIEAGNDSTDGLTIACSPLNSNGTLGAQGANFSNSDLSSNARFPSDLVLTTCNTTNAAVVTVYFNDILNSGREDALDGTGIGCNLISSTGISSTETDTQQPNDIVHHGTPIQSTSCPAGTVAVGITYDSFGSTLPADPDAMDSVVRLRCAPVVTSCTSTQCSDGIDNDGDGATDFPNDFSCSSSTDTDETLPRSQCQDSIDNDGDGLVDFPQDPGCNSRQDNTELNVVQCNDGIDNDGDGATDFPNDFSCSSSTDNDETLPRAACQDSIDNDGDGLVDFPQDPGCSSRQDNDEFNSAQCSDGIDNDGDGATDFPNDFSCSSSTDNDETLPRAACQDSVDNDGDGLFDFPQDPGCASRQDNDEFNSVQCNDGVDNDGDGATDFPNDFSCSSATDNDETLPRAACQDSIDNDGDGLVDFPQDPGCLSRQDNDEFNSIQADLNISKTGPTSVARGTVVSYTVIAANAGPNTATNVTIADPIPAGLTFNSAGSTSGCVQNGSNILCNNITLTSGQSVTRTIAFTVSATFVCSDTIQNMASVSTSATDPNPSNNQSSTVFTLVTCAQCSDGIDNDGDGATDFPNDFSCSSSTDNDETLPRAACQDSVDNDGDGLFDFPQDPGCTSNQDNNEFNSVQCNDGVDNDGDGATDFPNDFSCSSATDNDETLPRAACQDSIDNDGDGLVDFPQDPGCLSRQDNDEFNSVQCNDGVDNDGDGATDFPNDFSCSSSTDNDETLPRAACQDSVDNDGDGLVDFPQDPGCLSRQDNDEFNSIQADLSISKSGPSSVARGGTVSYTLTATNAGPNTATNVTIADPIPAGLTFSTVGSTASCVQNGSNILCNNITLTAGQSVTRTIAFTVSSTFTCGGSIQNQASVSTSATDPNPSNNQSGVVSTTVTCIECSDGIDNDGDGALDFPNDFSCSSSTDNDETLPRAACQDSVDNDGDGLFDFPQDPGCISNQDNNEFNQPNADLSIVKSGISSIQRGSTLLYTLTATNFGPDTATNVTMADPIPAGLTFNAGSSDAGCIQNGGSILCNNITLTAGQSATRTIAFNVPSTFTCNGTINNQASVSTSATDNNPGNNQSSVVSTTVTCPATDLTVSVSAPSSVLRGGTLTYTVSVSNISSTPAQNVQVIDPPVPAGFTTFNAGASSPSCSFNGSQVVCNAGTINAGQTVQFTIVFNVSSTTPCGTTLSNTVSVTTSSPETNTGDNTSTVSTTITCAECSDGIDNDGDGALDFPNDYSCSSAGDTDETLPRAQCQDSVDNDGDGFVDFPQDPGCISNQDNNEFTAPNADLSIVKSGVSSIQRGSTLLYTLTATNFGPDTAGNVTFADPIPAGLTFNAGNSDSGCVQNGGSVLCNNITLSAGQSVTRTIAFNVPSTFTCNGTINNQASVSTSATDNNPGNNQSAVVTTTVTCPLAQCQDGQDNDGDGATDFPNDFSCSSATDNDETLPQAQCQDSIDNDGDGLIDFPQDPGCASRQDNSELNTVQCNDGLDNDGDGATDYPNDFSCSSATDNDETLPRSACQDSIDNDGDGLSDFPQDPGCSNRQDNNEFNTVNSPACSDGVDNDGDGLVDFPQDPGCSSSSDTTESDFCTGSSTVQLGTSFLTAPTDDSQTDQFGSSVTRQVGGTFNCPAGQVITRVAYLGIEAGNDSTDGLTIACSPLNSNGTLGAQGANFANSDLSSNSRFPSDLVLTTCNTSNAAVVTVYFNDILNSGREDALDGTGIGCNLISSTGISSTETNTQRPNDIVHHGTPIDSTSCPTGTVAVGITYDSFGSTLPADPDAMDSVVRLRCAPVIASCTNTQCSDGVDNDGDGAVDFPADFSCSSATDNDETLPRAACQDSIDNDGDGLVDFPQDPGCNSNQDNDEFNQVQADLSISKSGPSSVQRGNTVSYTLTAFNAGPNTATNVTMADPIPAGLTFNAGGSSANCLQNGASILCNNITLTAGQSVSRTISFTVSSTFACNGTVNNQASVSTSATDNNPSNNQSTVVSTTVTCPVFQCSDSIDNDGDGAVDFPADFSCSSSTDNDETLPRAACQDFIDNDGDGLVDFPQDPGCSSNQDNDEFNQAQADLSVSKTGPSTVVRGGIVIYTLTGTNAGPNTATNVTFADPIPAGLTFNTGGSSGNCVQNGANILCNNITLTAGQSATVTVAFNVPSTIACNSIINNGASISTSTTDPNPANNQSNVVSTSVTCVQCSDNIDNDGDGATDFPADFSCSSATDNDETLPRAQCQDSIDNDGDGLIDFPQDPGCLSNQDNDEFNSIVADLSVTKTGPSSVVRGNTVTYTLTGTNAGPNTATNVTIADPIPAGLTFNAAGSSINCIQNDSNILCNNITLTAGQSATVTIAFNVPSTIACGSVINNGASISTSATDPNPSNNQSNFVSTSVTCVQCSDGFDNDSDGAIDFPADFSCSSATDNDETLPRAACQDFIDNDGDGLIDFPQDPGCFSNQDNDEFNQMNADLSISKTGPATASRSGIVSYNLTGTNAGPNTATNVTMADPIPAGLTFNAAGSSVNCIQNGANILCNNITLTAGQSATVTVAFNVPSTIACNSIINNGASISTSTTDPNPANNQSNVVSTSVTCVQCSDNVDNDGDGATDFPADFSCSSATDNDETLPRAQCQDSIDNDGDGLIDFPQDPGCISNQDNDEFNSIVADLSISKNGPSSVIRGNTVTYTLVGTNAGPNTATNVTFADPIPAGLTFNAAGSSINCIQNGSNILCNNITLTNGQSTTVSVSFNVPSSFTCNGVIQNAAAISTSATDPNPANNQSNVVSTTVTCVQCSDNVDNDGDGAIDFPNDFSCSSATDNDETLPRAQCQDSIDNDGDGFIDFPQDPGCLSNQDNDEFNSIVADLSVTKTGPSTVVRGNTVTYTLTGTNAGPNTATNVTFADAIPSGLTFNAAGSSVSCIQNGANILCNNITLTAGQSATVTIAFNVPSTFTCSGVIQNQASISTSATDPNPANNQSAVVNTTVTCPTPTFALSKTDGKTQTIPGDTLNYVISITNTSVTNATNVSVTDTLPSNVTFVSASGGTIAGNVVTFVIPAINAGQTITRTVSVTVNAGTANGTILTNTASIPSASLNATDTTTVFVAVTNADLSIVKSGVNSIQRGSTLLYTLTATNAGPATATNVNIIDPIPAGLTFNAAQSDVSCIQNGANILCNNLTLTSGQSATRIIAFDVPSTFTCNGTIQNQASVNTSATDPNPANNQSAVVSTTVTCPVATFSIAKTDGKTQTVPGDTLNYVISVTNTSVTNATNVTVTDTVPSNVTFVSASGGTLTGNVVTFVIPTLNAGQTVTRTLSVTVNAGTTNGTVITNTASVNGTPATDSTTVIVAVNQADLSIVKSGVNSIQRGSTMLYTLTATNAGPNTATNVTMADPIPAGLTFNAAQSDVSCIQNGANILCNNLTLTSGQSKTVLIAFDVPSTFTCNGTISNQASVSTSATDPNPANNQSTVISTTVTCPPATFSITKTDGRTTAAPADTLTYTITVQNTSAVNATNVTVTDTLPSNATFVSASGGTLAGNTVTFVIPTLNAGQSVQRTVIVTVNAGTANGTVLTNTASVNGTTATDTTTVTVVAQQADLSITKTGVSTIQRGSTILYTLTATNAGPNTATNVTIADAVPAGLTFAAAQSDVSCVLNGVNVLCNNFTLTSGQSKTVIVAFNVPSTFTCNGMISNQASVSTSATDPNPANNQSATVSTSVTCPPATFTISKTDNRTTALPGDTLNYAIIVTNTSVTNATNVTVTDTLPSNVTFVSATGGTLAGNVVTFVIPAINAGQSATRMVSVTVNAGTASGTVLSNTAAVSGTTATDTTTVSSVAQQADLSITKTGVSTIQRGSTILYTLTATNAGPNTATNVTIADAVPAGLTFVAAQSDASCILNGANILCNNFSLTSGQSKTVIVAFSVPSTFTCNGTIQNQASVSTSITDLNSANNQSQTVSTTVTCPTNTFTIAKTDNKTTATPGETLTYVITVRNTSATTVTNVNVTDTLPGNITFLSASGGVLAGNVVTFTIPSMGSGQTITRNVVITVNPGVTNGTVLTNTANVGTFQIQDTTTIQTGATFSITKTDNKTTAAPGETLTYAIVVTNTSATAATGISVTDTLPSNVTFLSATGAVRNGNTVTWSGINLTAGQSVTLPLQVQINSGVANGTVITNSASVGTVTVQDTTTVQTSGTATLTLSLSDSQDPVTPGQTFNYNVILTNATSTLASGVNVQQVLDGDSEFLSTSNSGTQSNGVISWTNLSVPANGSLTLVTTVRAKSTTQDGEILNSTAFSASISDSETTLIRGDGSNNDTAITLTVRDSADPVQIDECFDEIITVRNGRGITESVDVTGFLDPDMEFRDADRGGNQVGNDRVEWTDIVISANSSVTLHVTVCVDANAFDGRNLQFRARAEGSEDTEYTRVIDNGFLPPPIVPVPPFGEAIVTVDKSADRQEAQAGSVILYTVTIRNEGQTSTEDLVVEDSFTAGTVTVEEAGGGVMTGNGITWTGVRIGANSTRVLQYRVRVGAGMRNGEVISNTVTVRGGLTVVTDSEDVRILSNLPQAGGGGFLRADTTKHLRPRVAQEDASPITNLPMMVWTQILAIGLAAGSMIGRKLIGW